MGCSETANPCLVRELTPKPASPQRQAGQAKHHLGLLGNGLVQTHLNFKNREGMEGGEIAAVVISLHPSSKKFLFLCSLSESILRVHPFHSTYWYTKHTLAHLVTSYRITRVSITPKIFLGCNSPLPFRMEGSPRCVQKDHLASW